MKERPILMNGDMVRAVLAGKKTQTRRIIKPQPTFDGRWWKCKNYLTNSEQSFRDNLAEFIGCPFGNVGDRLWVRETVWLDNPFHASEPLRGAVYYCADYQQPSRDQIDDPLAGWQKYPSIHMPRWASRITLEITDVRVQRVKEITQEDAQAEGVEPGCRTCGENCAYIGGCGQCLPDYRDSFAGLWDSIYNQQPKLPKNTASKRYQRVKSWLEKNPGPSATSWQANPWVWAITFKRIDQ